VEPQEQNNERLDHLVAAGWFRNDELAQALRADQARTP
jgi:hypothetical protein